MLSLNRHSIFGLVWLSVLLLVLTACGSGEGNPKPPRPAYGVPPPPFTGYEHPTPELLVERPRTIIFMMIDTLRADHVGAYGDSNLTPNIDRFVEDSVLFERAISTCSWTRPSIATMFTGQYPSTAKVLTKADVLAPYALTLSEVLASFGGYHTFAVSTNYWAGKDFGFDQGFKDFVIPHQKRTHQEDGSAGFPADAVISEAKEWLSGHWDGIGFPNHRHLESLRL